MAIRLDKVGYAEERPNYVQWKIRVRTSLARQCRWLAKREGWQTADALRVLLCISTTLKFLGLPKDETFRKIVELRKMTGERAYRPRVGGGDTVLLSMRLPQGLSSLITTYANLTGRSRNQLVVKFIETGLLMYLKAENAFLEAISSLKPRAP